MYSERLMYEPMGIMSRAWRNLLPAFLSSNQLYVHTMIHATPMPLHSQGACCYYQHTGVLAIGGDRWQSINQLKCKRQLPCLLERSACSTFNVQTEPVAIAILTFDCKTKHPTLVPVACDTCMLAVKLCAQSLKGVGTNQQSLRMYTNVI